MATHAKKRKIFKRQLLLYPTGPNIAEFLLEPPWAEGIKIYTNPQGHMTNMAHHSQVYSNEEFDLWPVYSGERFRAFRPSCILFLMENPVSKY